MNNKGFSLIELLLAMVISLIITTEIYQTFKFQQRSYTLQEDLLEMQQNLRTAMYALTKNIRMAGYDPLETGNFGFQTAGSYNRSTGSDNIFFYSDLDNDNGMPDETNTEQIAFKVIKSGSNVTMKKSYMAGGWQPMAENIEALGFAYAFDDNEDVLLDTCAPGVFIWAIDSDNDGYLDKNIDTNCDGLIDINDSTSGLSLTSQVKLNKIRAVKIWLLGRSPQEHPDYLNTNIYVVGNQRISANDGYKRYLLTNTIKCRNIGL